MVFGTGENAKVPLITTKPHSIALHIARGKLTF